MLNFTTNTYTLKREILSYSKIQKKDNVWRNKKGYCRNSKKTM
jgi:hypothetical protein